MVWHYNYHPDFVPYYDTDKGLWAVSIQYLEVWYFRNEEDAKRSIPILKRHRLNVLKKIDKINQEYYKRIALEEEALKKVLHEARKHLEPTEKLCSALTKEEKKKLAKMLDAGYSDEEIMKILGISKRAVAIKRYHRYK